MNGTLVWMMMLVSFASVRLLLAQEEMSPPSEAPSPPSEAPSPPSQQGGSPAPSVDPNAPMADKQFEVFGPSSGAQEGDADTRSKDEKESAIRGATPEIYNVQRGDTLWDICQKMLDNPWYWPKLWSLNEYIANPHIIQPGNQVAFYSGSETTLPKMDVIRNGELPAPEPQPEAAAPVAEEPAITEAVQAGPRNIKLKSITVVSEKQMKDSGYISHSGEAKSELTAGDNVYIHFRKPKSVNVGDRFHAIRVIKKVEDPGAFFGQLGYLVKRTAVIQIRAIHKKTIEGMIVDSDDSITRDEKIIPYQSPIRTVSPHLTNRKINGTIVEAEFQQYLVSNNDFVFVNLGRKNGIDDGTELVVVRRGDGIFPEDDEKLPDVSVGKLLIVETGERASTAYVLDLKDSLQVGDRVRERAD